MSVLDDLLAKPDQQQILDSEVLPELVARGIRTTDWAPGDVTRADAYVAAKLRAMIREQLAVLAATRCGDYLFGFVPLPNATATEQADLLAWAPIIAKRTFGVDPIEATYTLRDILITNITATAYNKPAGRITIVFPSGNRYVSAEAYVSAGDDDNTVSFRSEFPVDDDHAYADVADTAGITFLTSDLPGVTATNPAADYSEVTQVGPGLGTLGPTGTPSGSHSIAIRIETTGAKGVATYKYSLDGGAWTGPTTIDDQDDQFGLAVDLRPANNGGDFKAGTIYYFSWPGSDVTQVGRPAETPQELGLRVRAQYPLLAFTRDSAGNALPISPVATAYQALVLQAFPEVKTCTPVTSATVNNTLTLYIAAQGALLPSSTVAAVGAFLASLGMIGDRVLAASPATQAITLAAANITVRSAQAVAAKAEAQRRVALYLSGVDPVQPLAYGGLIDRSYVISLIRSTPGVTKMDDLLTINGSAADYQLAAATMATYSGNVGTSLTWATS